MTDFLSRHRSVYKRVIIPRDLKPEIRDKLDQANINERVMFPGLDGLSRWLIRHYSDQRGARRSRGGGLVHGASAVQI